MHNAVMLTAMLLFAACANAEMPTAQRQSELRNLVHQDCGSCHGMRLTGGLGPALTSQALGEKSPAFLHTAISEGRTGTPMPPWKNLLSASDIDWIVDYLKQDGATP